MNMLAPQASRLPLDIVFDVICPWCYIGKRRLERALARRPEIAADITWRPFLLNPDMPPGGMPRHEYLVRKFGGEDRARRLYAAISEVGRAEGIAFAFDRIQRTPNSTDAHRFVRWASRAGRGSEAVEVLSAAYFERGLDIGARRVLQDLAAEIGLDPVQAYAWLAGDADADWVATENLRAHRLGITGVPCFIVAGRHAIAGAQEPEVLERLLELGQQPAA
ncbi:MAG: DsbA family oxidoreductase [Alphaproteobacteria bacterium]|nr:DsbA family oxidoreductase [Alphaproteobacteria bacterium]